MLPSKLLPSVPKPIGDKEDKYRQNQELNFNKRHKANELPILQPGDTVYLRDRQQEGHVIQRSQEPRSYLVKTSDGHVFRRNRAAIVYTSKEHQMTELNTSTAGEHPNAPVTMVTPHKSQKTVTSNGHQAAASVKKSAKTASTSHSPPSPVTSKVPEKAASPPRQQTRTRTNINPPSRYKNFVK
jgi:hypothetical protein